MKPRKVIVTLELTTQASLKALKDRELWNEAGLEGKVLAACDGYPWQVAQVQVNVARGISATAIVRQRKRKTNRRR